MCPGCGVLALGRDVSPQGQPEQGPSVRGSPWSNGAVLGRLCVLPGCAAREGAGAGGKLKFHFSSLQCKSRV